MSVRTNAEVILDDVVCAHGEGVIWSARRDELVWVDLIVGDVHRMFRDGRHSRVALGESVGAIAPTQSGGYIAACGDGFSFVDLDNLEHPLEPLAARVVTTSGVRMNDGACDSAGRFWAGTMAVDNTPERGCLYRVEATGQVDTILDHVGTSNGIGWNPSDDRCYYIDSQTGRIDQFGYDPIAGVLFDRRPFATIDSSLGVPDGLAIDSEGCVWVAIWGGGQVHRYTPRGRLDQIITLPTTQVSSCSFGGADLTSLYITTSQLDLNPEQLEAQPTAGKLFVLDARVSASAAAEFAA